MSHLFESVHLGKVVLILSSVLVTGCGGGQDLTARAIRDARRTWERTNLRDYDLEWTSSGAQTAHYRVVVRGGEVRSVRTVLPDGREIEARTAQPESFGVDGLFQILEEELAQLQADQPFGQPPGTTAVLRFDPDPQLGYPRSYRRDVVGAPKGIAIDVIRLVDRRHETRDTRHETRDRRLRLGLVSRVSCLFLRTAPVL